MASASWTQDDLRVGSISSNETKIHVDLGLLWAEDAHRGDDGAIALPCSSLQTSSLSLENLYGHPQNLSDLAGENLHGHPQNLSSAAMHDMSVKHDAGDFSNYPMEPAYGQKTMADSIVPFLGHEDPSFPGRRVTTSVNSRWQTNMMAANHDMNRHYGDRNFIDRNSNGARNFHMTGSDEALGNNTRQLDDTNRSLSDLISAPEILHEPDFVQKAYNNQLKVNAPQLDNLGKLDGRFLSLGYQSNSVFDGQSEGSWCTSFSHIGQWADDSLKKLCIPLSGFGENVGRLNMTPGYSNNINLSLHDGSALQTMTSGFDRCANPALPGGDIDMPHFMATPSIKSSGSKNEIGSEFSSIDTFQGCRPNVAIVSNVSVSNLFSQTVQRMTQGIPFNSSVLRSNHQNASALMQNSHLRNSMKLPHFGETSRQDQSGQSHPANASSDAGADEGSKMFHGGVSKSANQVYPLNLRQDINSTSSTGQGGVTTESGLFHPSGSLGRRSCKRSLPPISRTPEQCKKTVLPASTDPFSPYLLKNALGQIGESLPAFTTSTNPSLIPTVAMKGSAADNPTNLLTVPGSASIIEASSAVARASMRPPDSAQAFISPTQTPPTYNDSQYTSLGFCIPAMCKLASSSNIPATSAVAGEGCSSPPPITCAASSVLARTRAGRTGLLRVPVNSNPSKVLMPQTLPPSLYIPAPATVSRKKSSRTASSAVNALRKHLPVLAASAKAPPAYRTAQFPASVSHIKWQGFDMPRPTGKNCLLCKRDLSYNPEGPISIPPTAPAVAVLPCAHTFHDDCLSRITPADQSKDPPCIPCAIGEK